MNILAGPIGLSALRGSSLRMHNRALVLRTLRNHGPISRSRVGDYTGLKPPTLTRLVAELIGQELVEEMGSEPARSTEGGHPQVLLDLRARGAYVVGCHLGVRFVQVALADNRGEVLVRRVVRRPFDDTPDATIEVICDLVTGVAREGSIPLSQVEGIGIATVAIVNPNAGQIILSPEIGWGSVPLAELVEEKLGRPVAVDSNYRSFMRAEALYGSAQHARNALLVHVGTTIGAAIMIDHRIHLGDSFGAGRLGHAIADPSGTRCSCGAVGCLNVSAAEPSFARLASLSKSLKGSVLAEPVRALTLTPQDVYSAALASDTTACEVLGRSAALIAERLIDACLLLDIQLIVVSGPVLAAGDAFLDPLRTVLEERVRHVTGAVPLVVPSQFGTDVQITGAVALALDKFVFLGDALVARPDGERGAAPIRFRPIPQNP